jgi:hypothetical protein
MKIKIQIVTLLCLLVAGCGGSGSSQVPVNTAPTISTIADQSTSANVTSSAIPFTVTSATSLSFSTSSDNQQVVPDSGLDLVSNGASGSITVTPIVDTLGDAFITIIVTDQAGLSASTSFLLTIIPRQVSLQQFVRTEFARVEDGEPALINAVAFVQDAENDDFADLLAQ